MKIEYEEFENVGDLFLYLVSAAPPMKNTMPITVYKKRSPTFSNSSYSIFIHDV